MRIFIMETGVNITRWYSLRINLFTLRFAQRLCPLLSVGPEAGEFVPPYWFLLVSYVLRPYRPRYIIYNDIFDVCSQRNQAKYTLIIIYLLYVCLDILYARALRALIGLDILCMQKRYTIGKRRLWNIHSKCDAFLTESILVTSTVHHRCGGIA